MSNADYYKFEAALVDAIMAGEPDVVRGALAGAVKNSPDARWVVDLAERLRINCDPISKFRSSLRDLK